MATKLKKMKLTSVDLVPSGANQVADICLYKSRDGAHEDPHEADLATIEMMAKADPDRFIQIEEFP